jgi:hypothetical protein
MTPDFHVWKWKVNLGIRNPVYFLSILITGKREGEGSWNNAHFCAYGILLHMVDSYGCIPVPPRHINTATKEREFGGWFYFQNKHGSQKYVRGVHSI